MKYTVRSFCYLISSQMIFGQEGSIYVYCFITQKHPWKLPWSTAVLLSLLSRDRSESKNKTSWWFWLQPELPWWGLNIDTWLIHRWVTAKVCQCTWSIPLCKIHAPLSFQIRKPSKVIGDDVMVLAAWTRYYNNATVIRRLGDLLHRTRGTDLWPQAESI